MIVGDTSDYPSDPTDRRVDKGPAGFDIRSNWHFNTTYRIPQYAGNGLLQKLTSGWQASAIWSVQSGFAITPDLTSNRSRSNNNNAFGGPSDRPNLHNIPVRSEEGRQFRKAFVAAAGSVLLIADYNQIELRCIAHLADDPGLVTAFNAGEDIHRATAARVFGVDPADVTHEQRSKAKMVSYGLAYGMESYGLSQRLGIPVSEAAGILDSYFAAFPNVKEYMESAVAEARRNQYTETLFKRRRPIPELLSDNFRIRQAGERQAMNAAIQGLAADIFKIALVEIDRRLTDCGLASRLVLQVHDEVIVESPLAEHDRVNDVVLDAMKGAAELRVPLEVNAAWGPTWAEAKA